jgi:hypothetical protein
VGRGAADNDALTLHHARPHDLWLHARDAAGGHVLVPLDRGATCPADLLVDAATLAAHFSARRGEPVVDVRYAPRRQVRKVRGTPPGLVTVMRERVMALRLEPARLTRLLAAETLPRRGLYAARPPFPPPAAPRPSLRVPERSRRTRQWPDAPVDRRRPVPDAPLHALRVSWPGLVLRAGNDAIRCDPRSPA